MAVVAVLAVLWPLGRSLSHDSFPLSNYPMFTHDPARTTGFVRAVGSPPTAPSTGSRQSSPAAPWR